MQENWDKVKILLGQRARVNQDAPRLFAIARDKIGAMRTERDVDKRCGRRDRGRGRNTDIPHEPGVRAGHAEGTAHRGKGNDDGGKTCWEIG